MATPPEASPDYASACIRVGDFDVTFLTAGPTHPEEVDGEPETLLLLHGFGAWSEVIWGPVLPALARHHRVVAPDLLGFGHSSKPGEAFFDSPEPLAPGVRFLDAFMQAAGIERAVVVGNSFGGGLALRLAATRPHRVSRLVLVNSMGLGRTIHPIYKAISVPRLGHALVQPDRKRIRQMWHTLVHPDHRERVTEAIVERNFELLSEPGAAAVFRAARLGISLAGQKIVLTDFLSRVTQPTLVVWGKQDRIFPMRHGRRAAQAIEGARFEVLDPCGHVPPFERPDAFAAVLLAFLAEARAPPASPAASVAAPDGDAEAAAG